MAEKKQSRRYSLINRHSGWKKAFVKNRLEEANELVNQCKSDLDRLDEHVKKVEVEKTAVDQESKGRDGCKERDCS